MPAAILDQYGRAIRRQSGRARGSLTARERAILRGRFDAAQTIDENRRHWANADALSADAAASASVRQTLRNRARYEAENNSYAKGILLTLANDCVGTGPRLQMQGDDPAVNATVETLLANWARRVHLAAKLRTLRIARARDGEAFALLIANLGLDGPVKLDLRLLEADQVASPSPLLSPYAVDGIRFDTFGNPIEYDVLREHPGATGTATLGGFIADAIPARYVLHLFREDRPGQRRGIPEITPALPLFSQLRRYTLAVLGAAETAADYAAVLQNQNPPDSEDATTGDAFEAVQLEARMATVLPEGYTLGQIKAEQPATTYAEFKKEILNEAARCLLIPYNVAACNSADYNYASGRLDHQTYHKALRIDRGDLEIQFLDRLLEAFLEEAEFLGLVPAYFSRNGLPPHQWFWDGIQHVDPVKEAVAQKTRLASGTTTLAAEYAAENKDYETEMRQRNKEAELQLELRLRLEAREKELRRELGLGLPAPAPASSSPAIAAAADAGSALTFGAAGVEITAAGGDAQSPTPQVAIEAYSGGMMRVPKFGHVVIDLAGLAIEGAIPILADHDNRLEGIVGHGSATIRDGRLWLRGAAAGSETARQIVALAQGGFPFQASVGVDPGERIPIRAGQSITVNGRTITAPAGGFTLVRTSRLREVSIVPAGCDQDTAVTVTASSPDKGPLSMTFSEWLKAKGFDETTLSDAQKAPLQAAFEAELQAADNGDPPNPPNPPNPPANPPNHRRTATPPPLPTEGNLNASGTPDLVAKMRAELAAESQRIAQIRAACDGRFPAIEAKAIAEGWDETRTQLEVLRAERPTGPAIHSRNNDQVRDAAVIEAALCMQAGLNVEEDFNEQTLEAGYRYRRRGFRWCAEQLCASRGRPIDADPGSREWIQAAFSTSELSGIVGAVANKALQKAFLATPTVAGRICATRSHTNFHSHTVYSLAITGDLEQVGSDGELKHLKLGEESRTRQVQTKGALLSISRQDLVNDDLGAFTDASAVLGRKAVTSREKALFTLLNATGAGSSHFTTARGNYFAGASTNLQSSSLATAEQMFLDQTAPDGDPVSINPRILLVPTALKATARELMTSQFLVGPTTSKTPSNNVWQGAFEDLSSPWMSNTNLTGYSSTAWYLLADPADVPALEIAYLNGMAQPTIEFFGLDADPNVLGVTWRVYWDFGVALGEYRAGVKSKGAA